MALNFPKKSDGWDGFREAVAFPAEDEDSGATILCAITHAALVRHFGAVTGDRVSLLLAFRRYRPAIERIASAKYDATGRTPVVLLMPEEVAVLQRAMQPSSDTAAARKATG